MDFSTRECPAELTGPAANAVALTMVIAVAATAVPVIQVNQRAGMGYITFKLPGMTGLLRLWSDIRTMLSPVIRQHPGPVFKVRSLSVVFRMVRQGTATQVAGARSYGYCCAVLAAVRRPLPSRARTDLAYIVAFLTARQHAGVAVPVWAAWQCEWRISYALAEDDSWYSVSG